jgi:hypothetical protein
LAIEPKNKASENNRVRICEFHSLSLTLSKGAIESSSEGRVVADEVLIHIKRLIFVERSNRNRPSEEINFTQLMPLSGMWWENRYIKLGGNPFS